MYVFLGEGEPVPACRVVGGRRMRRGRGRPRLPRTSTDPRGSPGGQRNVGGRPPGRRGRGRARWRVAGGREDRQRRTPSPTGETSAQDCKFIFLRK